MHAPCVVCGGPISSKRSKTVICCSIACRDKRRHQLDGYGRTIPDRTCPVCSTVFRPQNANVRLCSRACKNAVHSVLMAGEANPNYRDGGHVWYWTRKFRKTLSPALRAKWKSCMECGAESPLVAHHLDESTRNDTPGNLAVLCRGCHAKFHKSKNPALRASMTSRWTKIIRSSLEGS